MGGSLTYLMEVTVTALYRVFSCIHYVDCLLKGLRVIASSEVILMNDKTFCQIYMQIGINCRNEYTGLAKKPDCFDCE